MQGCTSSSLVSDAWNWPPAAAFVSAGSLDKKMCPYWWPGVCCALPLIPQTAYTLQSQTIYSMHNKVAANTFSLLTHMSYSSRWILTCFTWMCIHRILLKNQSSVDIETGNTHRWWICVLFLIPFGIAYWHQTLSWCRWACTNFAIVFKDTDWDKQKHANNSMCPESKLWRTHCETEVTLLRVFVLLMDFLCRECLVAPSETHYSSYHVCAGNLEREV